HTGRPPWTRKDRTIFPNRQPNVSLSASRIHFLSPHVFGDQTHASGIGCTVSDLSFRGVPSQPSRGNWDHASRAVGSRRIFTAASGFRRRAGSVITHRSQNASGSSGWDPFSRLSVRGSYLGRLHW